MHPHANQLEAIEDPESTKVRYFFISTDGKLLLPLRDRPEGDSQESSTLLQSLLESKFQLMDVVHSLRFNRAGE
ncbi:hypothetical protein GF380_05565 [Candidatus Uhrbacteria bacterium]|nr:hypothetical protein [Candidatus Uhrbacteria bacterium]